MNQIHGTFRGEKYGNNKGLGVSYVAYGPILAAWYKGATICRRTERDGSGAILHGTGLTRCGGGQKLTF